MAPYGPAASQDVAPSFPPRHSPGRFLPPDAGKSRPVALVPNETLPADHVFLRLQPYRAQGAAMAIEDAAVLGHLLSRLAHPEQLPVLLQAYEALRLPRTAETQSQSRLNQAIFHLPDGPEQRQRDADMRQAAELERGRVRGGENGMAAGDASVGSTNQWADEKKSRIQFGYDADEAAERWWRDGGERLLQSAAGSVNGKVHGGSVFGP